MRVLPCIIALCVAAAPGAARADLFHLWSQGYGDTLTPGGIAVDSDGSIAVAGNFIGSIDLGGGALTSAGLYDIFLVRLNPDGTHRWSRAFGGAQSQLCHAMAMAPNGDVVITGYFGGTVDFGGGPLVSVDEPDLYLACFDRDGNHRWSRAFPRPQPQYGQDVVVDASGNVVVTGGFLGRVDLGGGLLSSFGAVDAFLARYDALGNHVWSQRFGGVSNEEGRGVATDAAGNIVMMGYFNGAIDLGDGTLASAGDWDIFLARWDASGNVDWSRRFGDRYLDSPVALACAPGGDIVLTNRRVQRLHRFRRRCGDRHAAGQRFLSRPVGGGRISPVEHGDAADPVQRVAVRTGRLRRQSARRWSPARRRRHAGARAVRDRRVGSHAARLRCGRYPHPCRGAGWRGIGNGDASCAGRRRWRHRRRFVHGGVQCGRE